MLGTFCILGNPPIHVRLMGELKNAINLAPAEIYPTLANFFQRFGSDMKLVDTVRKRDVDITSDLIIPAHVNGSKDVTINFVGGWSRGK